MHQRNIYSADHETATSAATDDTPAVYEKSKQYRQIQAQFFKTEKAAVALESEILQKDIEQLESSLGESLVRNDEIETQLKRFDEQMEETKL